MSDDRILLAHGAGGKLTAALIEKRFLPRYGNDILATLGDGAVIPSFPGLPVISTDSYVVRPYFFPGGDIGSLAVNGTVNDLAMCGGEPRAISVAFILEEGLPAADLDRICESIGAAARRVGVPVVTGDTKVVERGHGDGIFVTTTGLGERTAACGLDPARMEVGDRILINGPVGQHGIAVLAARQELRFRTPVVSDSKALIDEARALLALGGGAVKALHDPTRGGLATCLNELAAAGRRRIVLEESSLPRDAGVEAACELLGFDSLYVANEGKLVAVVAADRAEEALAAVRAAGSPQAALIGEVIEGAPLVLGRSALGGERLLDVLSGDPLPRIC